jgi:hypothetical protein
LGVICLIYAEIFFKKEEWKIFINL